MLLLGMLFQLLSGLPYADIVWLVPSQDLSDDLPLEAETGKVSRPIPISQASPLPRPSKECNLKKCRVGRTPSLLSCIKY